MTKDTKKRREDVLAMIVAKYVETAEPVGSRFVAQRLGLSSATIRNVMADLEDMGFVSHPHTSAGRVPTDKGYRYYIESLLPTKNLNEHTAKSIKDEYGRGVHSAEDVFEGAAHFISQLTNYVGMASFNDYHKLYMDGAFHMLEQPEFTDVKRVYALLKCLEEKKQIMQLLEHDAEGERLTVYIGKETGSGYLAECSIVTRGYKVKNKVAGKVGVIGPKRMLYEKVIPAVEFLADTMSEMMEQIENDRE